jgi:hypothetical protein
MTQSATALSANASLSQRSSTCYKFSSNFEIILTSAVSGKRKCDAQNVNSTKKSRKAITLEIKHEIWARIQVKIVAFNCEHSFEG